MEKTYWIARWKSTGHLHGSSQAVGAKLYVSEKMARARVRHENQTNEQQDLFWEFIPVTLTVKESA
jgi:hypothetical protein